MAIDPSPGPPGATAFISQSPSRLFSPLWPPYVSSPRFPASRLLLAACLCACLRAFLRAFPAAAVICVAWGQWSLMGCCNCCCADGEECCKAPGPDGICCAPERCCGTEEEPLCCSEGENCCDGVCQEEPCDDTGACCVYEDQSDEQSGLWAFVGCTDTTAEECTADEGQYASFKLGVSCSDDPDPCVGDPDGTCCDEEGGCLQSDPGPGEACYPTGAPGDDGCFCDSACYTICFDCCGADAIECCLGTPALNSLWDDSAGPGLQKLSIHKLEANLAQYGVDMEEAWGAAMQSGAGKQGSYYTLGWARVSLILCLQDIADGVVPWKAVATHQQRVRAAATALRRAGK